MNIALIIIRQKSCQKKYKHSYVFCILFSKMKRRKKRIWTRFYLASAAKGIHLFTESKPVCISVFFLGPALVRVYCIRARFSVLLLCHSKRRPEIHCSNPKDICLQTFHAKKSHTHHNPEMIRYDTIQYNKIE